MFPNSFALTAGIVLYRDVCKRVSTCGACRQAIVKGERRIVFYATRQTVAPITTSKGGKIYRYRKFYHPRCFSEWALEETGDGSMPLKHTEACFDCRLPLTAPGYFFNRAYLHKRGANVYLCGICKDSPRWRYCRYCQQYVKRYSASPITMEEVPDGHFACDYCADENPQIMTVKKRKRMNREQRAHH